jgi:hypothetical protein
MFYLKFEQVEVLFSIRIDLSVFISPIGSPRHFHQSFSKLLFSSKFLCLRSYLASYRGRFDTCHLVFATCSLVILLLFRGENA